MDLKKTSKVSLINRTIIVSRKVIQITNNSWAVSSRKF